MTEAPAFIRNGRLDILATNRLAKALYRPLFQDPARPVNMARYLFLSPGAAEYMTELDHQRASAAALLRTEAGRDPYNLDLTLTAMSAEPDTPSADGLKLLAGWAATLDGDDQPTNEPISDRHATHEP